MILSRCESVINSHWQPSIQKQVLQVPALKGIGSVHRHCTAWKHRQIQRPTTYWPCKNNKTHRFTRSNTPRSQLLCKASLVETVGFVAGVCFDQQCQQAADRAFLAVTSIPLLGLLAAVILRFRPPSAASLNKDEVSLHNTLLACHHVPEGLALHNSPSFLLFICLLCSEYVLTGL